MNHIQTIDTQLKLFDLLDADEGEYDLLINRANTLDNCRYYSPISLLMQNTSFRTTNEFRLLHHNVRSLVKNGEMFKDFLHNANISLSAILVTETWLRDGVPLTEIPNFSFAGNNRKGKAGGGVGIYVNDAIDSQKRSDLMTSNPAMENITIEVNRINKKNVIIICIYRPPDANFMEFKNELQKLLSKLESNNKVLFIGGDFNLNILDYNNDGPTTQFIDLMISYNLFPTISRPTRMGNGSNTLIDCIFTNLLSPAVSGVITEFGISDHLPIFLSTELPDEEKAKAPQTNQRRKITPEMVARFNRLLSNELANFTSINSTDQALHVLTTTIASKIDAFLPIIKQNRKTVSLKPWISKAILNSINVKNNLYKDYRKNRSQENMTRFNVYKNRLMTVIRAAKKKHFQDLIAKNKDDSKKTWEILKEAIGSKTNRTCEIKNLSKGSVLISDTREIANGLNDFFTTVGTNLEQSIPPSPLDPTSFIHDDIPNTCFLQPVSAETISTILAELKNKGDPLDPTSIKLLKLLSPSISGPLSHLVNLCFSSGSFPDELKIATVTPIFKAGAKDSPGNYRPISVLPPISKIIEKCIYQRIIGFISSHGILSETQYGFRTKHSTEHALITFIDYATHELEQGKYVMGVYLDIKKAFDSVNHSILFQKLQKYGIRGTSLQLIKSYLRSRYQKVKLLDSQGNKITSENKPITCGVPQGSVLGPLLFLLYVNDLKNASEIFRTITFADDTNLFISHNHLPELCNLVNSELEKVLQWFHCNRICLNFKCLENLVSTLHKKDRVC